MDSAEKIPVTDVPLADIPPKKKKNHAWFIVVALLVLAAVSWAGITMWKAEARRRRILRQRQERWLTLGKSLEQEVKRFRGTSGIIVKDLTMGWELTFQKDKKFPAASMVKLPVMMAVYESVDEGKMRLDEAVVLRGSDKTGGSGILKGIPSGRQFTVEQLVELMVAASDNTATNILIKKLDMARLNEWFKAVGLERTNLARLMMDFRRRSRGYENYTCAADMGYALERLYRQDYLNGNFSRRCLDILKRQRVKDRIPRYLPHGTVVAHKTGLERSVCHDAGIIYTPNGDYLVCVMTRNAPNHGTAKEFIAKVASRVYGYASEAPEVPQAGFFKKAEAAQ